MTTMWHALHHAWVVRRCERAGVGVRVLGRVFIHGQGRVFLGDHVVLDARQAPIEIHAFPGAEVHLGDHVNLHGGVSIEARHRVTLGSRVVVGGFSKIMDNNFHPLGGNRHALPPSSEVRIEDDVCLGWRVVVLPGAVLRRATLVSDGSVVRGTMRAAAAPMVAP